LKASKGKRVSKLILTCAARKKPLGRIGSRGNALPEHVRQEQIRATKCKNAKHAAAKSKGEEIAGATGHAVNLANPTSKWAKWIFTCKTCYVRDTRMLVRHMCDKKDRATYLTKAKKHST